MEAKFTANDLLDSMNREFNQFDMNEIYKALMAYSIGLKEIDENTNEALDIALDWYMNNDGIISFINEDLYGYVNEMFD